MRILFIANNSASEIPFPLIPILSITSIIEGIGRDRNNYNISKKKQE